MKLIHIMFAMTAVLYLAPVLFQGNVYWVHILTLGGIYSILAMSWDFTTSIAGQMQFCQGAFYGIGAYASAIISTNFGVSPWLCLIIAGLLTGGVGTILSMVTARLKGHYLAISTVGFATIVYLIALGWYEVTRGPEGIYGIPPFPGVGKSEIAAYYLIITFSTVISFLFYKLITSDIGSKLRAIRGDELLAKHKGINTSLYRVAAFAIGSFFGGLAGSLYCHTTFFVSPEVAYFTVSILAIAMAVIGGQGTVVGPAIFSYILWFLMEYLRIFSPTVRILLIGLSIILTIKLAPRGILSRFIDKKERRFQPPT